MIIAIILIILAILVFVGGLLRRHIACQPNETCCICHQDNRLVDHFPNEDQAPICRRCGEEMEIRTDPITQDEAETPF